MQTTAILALLFTGPFGLFVGSNLGPRFLEAGSELDSEKVEGLESKEPANLKKEDGCKQEEGSLRLEGLEKDIEQGVEDLGMPEKDGKK